jgi:hypothetical protein
VKHVVVRPGADAGWWSDGGQFGAPATDTCPELHTKILQAMHDSGG